MAKALSNITHLGKYRVLRRESRRPIAWMIEAKSTTFEKVFFRADSFTDANSTLASLEMPAIDEKTIATETSTVEPEFDTHFNALAPYWPAVKNLMRYLEVSSILHLSQTCKTWHAATNTTIAKKCRLLCSYSNRFIGRPYRSVFVAGRKLSMPGVSDLVETLKCVQIDTVYIQQRNFKHLHTLELEECFQMGPLVIPSLRTLKMSDYKYEDVHHSDMKFENLTTLYWDCDMANAHFMSDFIVDFICAHPKIEDLTLAILRLTQVSEHNRTRLFGAFPSVKRLKLMVVSDTMDAAKLDFLNHAPNLVDLNLNTNIDVSGVNVSKLQSLRVCMRKQSKSIALQQWLRCSKNMRGLFINSTCNISEMALFNQKFCMLQSVELHFNDEPTQEMSTFHFECLKELVVHGAYGHRFINFLRAPNLECLKIFNGDMNHMFNEAYVVENFKNLRRCRINGGMLMSATQIFSLLEKMPGLMELSNHYTYNCSMNFEATVRELGDLLSEQSATSKTNYVVEKKRLFANQEYYGGQYRHVFLHCYRARLSFIFVDLNARWPKGVSQQSFLE